MLDLERGRARLMGLWNALSVKVGPTSVTAEHGDCPDCFKTKHISVLARFSRCQLL